MNRETDAQLREEASRIHSIAMLAAIRARAAAEADGRMHRQAKQARVWRIPAMTHEQYYTRHERRPAWQRADTWWTVAIIVGIFVAGALAELVTR